MAMHDERASATLDHLLRKIVSVEGVAAQRPGVATRHIGLAVANPLDAVVGLDGEMNLADVAFVFGLQLDFVEDHLADVDLDDPGGVGEQDLDVPWLLAGAPPADLAGALLGALAVGVQDPGVGRSAFGDQAQIVDEPGLVGAGLPRPLLRDGRWSRASDEVVIDRAFGTTDVMVVLPRAAISPKRMVRITPATTRSGQADPVPNTPRAASITARLPSASLREQIQTERMLASPSLKR